MLVPNTLLHTRIIKEFICVCVFFKSWNNNKKGYGLFSDVKYIKWTYNIGTNIVQPDDSLPREEKIPLQGSFSRVNALSRFCI